MFLKHLLIFTLIFSSITIASETQINLTVTPNNLTIGSPINYIIKLEMDTTKELVKVPVKKDFIDKSNITFIENSNKKTVSSNIRQVILNYKISIFELGNQSIPTQTIILKDSLTKKFSKYVLPAYPLFINSISGIETTENLSVKISDSLYFELNLDLKIIIFGILFILTVILIIIFGYKQFKKNTQQKPHTKKELIKQDPYQEFIEQINTNYRTINKLEIKDYYVKYSEIIKVYLSIILKINTIELTSIEIFSIAKKQLNEQDLRRLKNILSFSDQVKFAKYIPEENENKEFLEKAIDTISKINHHYLEKESNITTKKEPLQWYLQIQYGYSV